MKRHSQKSLALILSATMIVTACSTNPYTSEREISNTAFGPGIGAAIGTIGGAIVGGIGALAGGGVGFYMDQQEAKLREQLVNSGVQVIRDGDNIILNMPSNITFASNSSELTPDFENVPNSVSLVIKEYKKTYVDVLGHTDSSGAGNYNMNLSVERAQSIANMLVGDGLAIEWLIVKRLGEDYPIADNNTEQGKSQNRRVEIALSPLV